MLLERRGPLVGPYRGELLTAAEDLALRLLPAFNTASGIPLSWVNLLTVCARPPTSLWAQGSVFCTNPNPND